MNETKTPRTDAFIREEGYDPSPYLWERFSRELETELAAAIAAKERAEADAMSALDLVSRIRQALGDDGKRMQDELIEWCRTLANTEKDANRYRWLRHGRPRTTGMPRPERIEVLQWENRQEANALKGTELDAAIDSAIADAARGVKHG